MVYINVSARKPIDMTDTVLTDAEWSLIINALYEKSQNDLNLAVRLTNEGDDTGLAVQFTRQSDTAKELAQKIESTC